MSEIFISGAERSAIVSVLQAFLHVRVQVLIFKLRLFFEKDKLKRVNSATLINTKKRRKFAGSRGTSNFFYSENSEWL